MSQTIIRATFMTALAAYANAHSPPLEIAREGFSFTKPSDGSPFLEAFLTPADTRNPTVDGTRKRYWGEFTINVWTKDNIGAGTGERIAEEIAALFPVVPKNYLPVNIMEPPSIKKAIPDNGWRITPLCINYMAEF